MIEQLAGRMEEFIRLVFYVNLSPWTIIAGFVVVMVAVLAYKILIRNGNGGRIKGGDPEGGF